MQFLGWPCLGTFTFTLAVQIREEKPFQSWITVFSAGWPESDDGFVQERQGLHISAQLNGRSLKTTCTGQEIFFSLLHLVVLIPQFTH